MEMMTTTIDSMSAKEPEKKFISSRSWKGKAIIPEVEPTQKIDYGSVDLRVELHEDGYYHLFRDGVQYTTLKAPEFHPHS
jgi:hypothetical protein